MFGLDVGAHQLCDIRFNGTICFSKCSRCRDNETFGRVEQDDGRRRRNGRRNRETARGRISKQY